MGWLALAVSPPSGGQTLLRDRSVADNVARFLLEGIFVSDPVFR